MPAAAQVSIYPLRQESLTPVIEKVLEGFRDHGLDVSPGAMSSIVTGDDDSLFEALKEAFQKASLETEIVMVVTISNACPVGRFTS